MGSKTPFLSGCWEVKSAYNCLKTAHEELRSCWNAKPLYVHFNMTILEEWNPRPCIIRWLKQEERRKKTTGKASGQWWFKGVLKEAMHDRRGEVGDTPDTHMQLWKREEISFEILDSYLNLKKKNSSVYRENLFHLLLTCLLDYYKWHIWYYSFVHFDANEINVQNW